MFKVGAYIPIKYQCPICRKSYDEHGGANECINNHVVPVDIHSFDEVKNDGPEQIIINLSNNTKGRYKLVEVI